MGRDAGRGVANAKVSMIDLCACLPPLYPPLTPAARFYANNYRIYKPVRTLRYTLVVHTVRFPYIPFASSKPACGPAAARTRPRRPSPRPALSSWSRPWPSIGPYVDVPHALPIRRRSDCLALCMASFSCSLPSTFCLRMLPTMTMREPSMSTAKSVPTSGLERLSKNESCGRIGVRVRVGLGVEVGALGPCGPQAP